MPLISLWEEFKGKIKTGGVKKRAYSVQERNGWENKNTARIKPYEKKKMSKHNWKHNSSYWSKNYKKKGQKKLI